jgi:hypothetical protein
MAVNGRFRYFAIIGHEDQGHRRHQLAKNALGKYRLNINDVKDIKCLFKNLHSRST